jgi:chromosome segregation ATPase
MARTGITFDDVARSANELLSRGENPTIQRIREQLGSGSNTTIANHLRRWQQARREASVPALPPTVPEGLMPALETFWQSATREAHALFEWEREAFRSELETARLAQEDAQYSLQRLEHAHSELTQQLAEITDKLAEQTLAVEQERSTRQKLETELHTAAERHNSLESLLSEARAAAEALEIRHRDELATWQTQQEQRMLDERQHHASEIKRLLELVEYTRDQAQQAQQQANAELDQTRQRWTQVAQEREQRVTEQLQVLEDTCQQEREARRNSEQRYAELRGRVAQQAELLQRLEQTAAEGHQRELTLSRENERLHQQLAQSEETVQQLRESQDGHTESQPRRDS